MQHCSCRVLLAGNQNMQVVKADVTVAEIAVLRRIHGADAVTRIKPIYSTKESHAVEADRLRREYDAAIFEALFPGMSPRLPVKLVDIGIAMDGTPDELTAPPVDPEDTSDRVSRQLAAAAERAAGEAKAA